MDKTNILVKVFNDFARGDAWWEVLIVALCALLTYGTYRVARHYLLKFEKPNSFLRPAARRLLPPFVLLLLLATVELFVSTLSDLSYLPPLRVRGNLVNLMASLVFVWLLLRLFFVLIFVAFQRANWVRMVMRVIEIVVWVSVVFRISGLFDIIGKQISSLSFLPNEGAIDPANWVRGGLIIAMTLLFTLAISAVIERKLLDTRSMAPNLQIVLGRLAKALLVTLGVLFSLSLVGFPLGSLSIFGGALGVGLGFGLQKIMSNYISGFIILTDRSVQIGDFVTVDNFFGQVTQITTRYMMIRGTDGTEAIVPNETVLTSVVENHTCSDGQLMLNTSVSINHSSDIGLAMQLIFEAVKRERRVLKEPGPNVFFKEFGEHALVLQAFFWIDDLGAGRLSLISRINLSILELFQESGIELALPKRIVRNVTDTPDTELLPVNE